MCCRRRRHRNWDDRIDKPLDTAETDPEVAARLRLQWEGGMRLQAELGIRIRIGVYCRQSRRKAYGMGQTLQANVKQLPQPTKLRRSCRTETKRMRYYSKQLCMSISLTLHGIPCALRQARRPMCFTSLS